MALLDGSAGLPHVLLGVAAKYGLPAGSVGRATGVKGIPPLVRAPTAQTKATPPPAPQQPDFSTSVLRAIGAPVNPSTTQALRDWMAAEGGPSDNPLNTTLGQGGAQGSAIKGYGSTGAGISATVKTLQNGLYSQVIQAFKSSNPNAIRQAVIASPWDRLHYANTDYAKGLVHGTGVSLKSPSAGSASALGPRPANPPLPPFQNIPIPGDIPMLTDPSTAAQGMTRHQALTQLLLSSGGRPITPAALMSLSRYPTSLPARTGASGVVGGAAASMTPGAPATSALPLPGPATGGTSQTSPSGGTGYQNLFGQASGVHASRVDQGVDYYGIKGPVGAVDSGQIVEILPASQTGGFGDTIVQHLANGKFVYYGMETGASVDPRLKVGQNVTAGQQIATGIPSGSIEFGFAQSGKGILPLTPATGSHDIATSGGKQFAQYISGPVHVHRNGKGQIIPYRTT